MNIRTVTTGRNVLTNLFSGVGAEVGVERGKYSEVIMENHKVTKLYLVDLWQNYPGYREHVSDAEYEEIFKDAQKRLKGKNVEFFRMSSSIASHIIADNSLDFVYVDAAHDYESVEKDLRSWYAKVKSGGVVSGHDYIKKEGFGVIQAVKEFVAVHNIGELTIWGGDKSPSWHFIKP